MLKNTDGNVTTQQCTQFSMETALPQIEQLLRADYAFSKRAIALLLLQQDGEIEAIVRQKESSTFDQIKKIILATRSCYCHPLHYIIAIQRQQRASEIARYVTEPVRKAELVFAERLSRLTMNPITGLPILVLVLYLGLYKFVGVFGAGILVDFLENTIFQGYINPFAKKLFSFIIPVPLIQDLFVGEYGIITLGLRYAVAIILPIVAVFFLVFAVIEDTGYLPRLAMLIDRIFKKIGLSGRAVIPMVLGFGCDTMATMVTRTLPTKRERVIATMLLALAVPCSAQLGVIMAILAGKPLAILVWAGVILLVFLFVGYLGAKILPGERPVFYMEVPPLRLPVLSNVLIKTYSRVVWYLKEIMPLFIFVSAIIWVGQITKLFDFVITLMKVPVKLIGLPPEAAYIFVLGFFRRDYGAAGLYDLNAAGALSGVQLVVASVALTLFLPCVAQLLINIKERGIKTGINISLFVLVVSFLVSFALNYILVASGMVL
jgi:ferrous iron transport protein B